MITDFEGRLNTKTGSKGYTLMLLKQRGFNVPNGLILDCDTYDEVIASAGLETRIDALLDGLTAENAAPTSEALKRLFDDGVTIPDEVQAAIRHYIDPSRKYAVRSSGNMEDSGHHSFAGQYQTFLNVQGLDNILNAILACYRSMFSAGALLYLVHCQLCATDLKMAVVIQDMVEADCSGIAFTINPLTGNDREIVVELVSGLGEDLVSGRANADKYHYNWYDDRFEGSIPSSLLNQAIIQGMMAVFLDIQLLFGYPCDIEFAVQNQKLYILQARPITRIEYAGIQGIWTTANFKDGGVSSSVCTPFMWSLYEYIWEHILRKFLLDARIISARDSHQKMSAMFFGRPYWNLSVVKTAMSKIPGYKEREFDADYGIEIKYEGNGVTTGFTVSALFRIIRIVLAHQRMLKDRQKHARQDLSGLMTIYSQYRARFDDPADIETLELLWCQLTQNDYLKSESTYFWQVFLNAIHHAMLRDSLLKQVSSSDYLGLLGGIEDISHLRPFYDSWELSRNIRRDPEALAFWTETPVKALRQDFHSGARTFYLDELARFIEHYGYHSDKELDITYPCYYEAPDTIIRLFKDLIQRDEAGSPVEDRNRQRAQYTRQLEQLREQMAPRRFRKMQAKIDQMRKMLWWREEFRDVSTRFYCLIRIYTLRLAQCYAEHGVLESAEDIWMLKVTHLWGFIKGNLGSEQLRQIASNNRRYYDSFRNYISENELGSALPGANTENAFREQGITGLGCNNVSATGTARVIEGLHDIDRLQPGDILVTKFTDTGWTCKFAMLSGIITEYGGILCHAAVVSREYGIPCIVAAQDVMEKIQDGSRIMMDGATGRIIIIEG